MLGTVLRESTSRYVLRTETTQSDWMAGTLSTVDALASGDLVLHNTPSPQLDGASGYASLGSPAALNLTSAWTLEAWVYPVTRPEGSGVIAENYTTAGDTNVTYELGFGMDEAAGGSSKLKVGFFNGAWYLVADSADIPLGAWVHIAGTWDGTTLTLYKNGALVGSLAAGSTPPAGVGPYLIGRRHDTQGSVPYFPGYVNEVRIWNVARTQAQIQGDMNTTLAGNETGLVGYWPCMDGSGATLADKTSNANNGTLSGTYTWTNFYSGGWSALSGSGSRTSPSLDLSSISSAQSSKISWTATLPANTTLTVSTSIDGGTTWTAATNGGAIAGVTAGADLSGKALLVKQDLSTTASASTPDVADLTVFVS